MSEETEPSNGATLRKWVLWVRCPTDGEKAFATCDDEGEARELVAELREYFGVDDDQVFTSPMPKSRLRESAIETEVKSLGRAICQDVVDRH